MFTKPTDLDESQLRKCLATHWDIEADDLQYQPVGFGSHHWVATVGGRSAWFVSVDDLRSRLPPTERTLDAAFDGLASAFATARILADAGLEFVVGPEPTSDALPIARLSAPYSVVVHPYLTGHPAGQHGEYDDRSACLAMVPNLVALHRATSLVEGVAVVDDLSLPGRDDLEDALGDLRTPWGTGPFAESSRALLRDHADGVRMLLTRYDEWAEQVSAARGRVITHGEPNASNVVITGQGMRLVDWESARIAPPERDLWVLDPGDGSVLDAYRRESGREADHTALACYRLWYDLYEIAGYVTGFRVLHERTADTEESWRNLVHFCRPEMRWPAITRADS